MGNYIEARVDCYSRCHHVLFLLGFVFGPGFCMAFTLRPLAMSASVQSQSMRPSGILNAVYGLIFPSASQRFMLLASGCAVGLTDQLPTISGEAEAVNQRSARSKFFPLFETSSNQVGRRSCNLSSRLNHLLNRDFRNPQERQEADVDVLREFSEACREELHV